MNGNGKGIDGNDFSKNAICQLKSPTPQEENDDEEFIKWAIDHIKKEFKLDTIEEKEWFRKIIRGNSNELKNFLKKNFHSLFEQMCIEKEAVVCVSDCAKAINEIATALEKI